MASTKSVHLETLTTIEADLNQVNVKKQRLKQAYDDLHSQLSILSSPSSFSLSWSFIDDHFTLLHNHLATRFRLLQTLEPSVTNGSNTPLPSNSSVELNHGITYKEYLNNTQTGLGESQDRVDSVATLSLWGEHVESVDSVVQWPELVSLCERMDGKGLREFVNDHSKERAAVRGELLCAMHAAKDPGMMVLDAMEGFCELNSIQGNGKAAEVYLLKKGCVDLFEVLVEIRPELSDKVKERAKKISLGWKKKLDSSGDTMFKAIEFLKFVAAYRLHCEFDKDELVAYFVHVRRYKQAKVLYEVMELGDKVPDIIQKLIENGKQLLAIKFIFESGLIDKFQPVQILRAYLNDHMQVGKKICEEENNSPRAQNDARSRELNALRSVLKIVDDHKLASEYPRVEILKRLKALEKQKPGKKAPASSADTKSQQLQHPASLGQSTEQQRKKEKRPAFKHQLDGSKYHRITGPTGPSKNPVAIPISNLVIHPYQQSYVHTTGGHYGLLGPTHTPTLASYVGRSPGALGQTRTAIRIPEDPGHSAALLHSSEAYVPQGYSGTAAAYGEYGYPPQYHPTYYPQ